MLDTEQGHPTKCDIYGSLGWSSVKRQVVADNFNDWHKLNLRSWNLF